VLATWATAAGKTNALQRAAGDGGYHSNNFSDIYIVTNTTGPATNGVGRCYRVRLVP
jgi:hypothetical protein